MKIGIEISTSDHWNLIKIFFKQNRTFNGGYKKILVLKFTIFVEELYSATTKFTFRIQFHIYSNRFLQYL